MSLLKRVILYTILLLINCVSTILLIDLEIEMINIFVQIIIIHIIINVIFIKYYIRLSIILNIIISSIVSTLTLPIALLISELEIISYSIDFYGIYTAIVSKGILTVFFLEVVYQIKNRIALRKTGLKQL